MEELEDLKRQLEEVYDFIENAPVPLHWVNGSGIIIWANQAELDLLGYEKNEYINKHISNFHVERETIEDILVRLVNKEVLVNYPSRLRCKNGSTRQVLITSNVYRKDGEFIHTRCFTRDITDDENQKVLEGKNAKNQAIRNKKNTIEESTLLNRMILEVKDYAILVLGKDGTVKSWNKGAERIKGYTEQEIIGQNFNIFYLPQDRQSGLPEKLLAQAVKNGRAQHEGFRLRKNGTTFWGNIVITAIHDDDNNVIGFTKVTSDLTERKDLGHILNQEEDIKI